MPGDLFGRVLQEIAGREARPRARDVGLADAPLDEQSPCGVLGLAHQVLRIDRALQPPAQGSFHALVEVPEQRCLPGVPQLRIGGAHVRAGEHVQVIQVRLVADLARERVDDLRVADVLLLRGDRQLQVVAHQPGDQARIVRGQALLETERLRVHRAELGMIAAAPLGNVVKQRGEVGDFAARQLLHDARGFRQLMVVTRDREAAQVAHHEQRMRIDRVGMEQVVLHAPDDAPECRDVAPQHAVGVHAPQLVRDAHRRAQDLEEQAVMARVLAELLVDEPQIARHRAHGRGAHAAQSLVLLQQHEQLQQRCGRALEHLLADRFEGAVAHLEARIQRPRRLALGEDRFAEQLQQQLVQQAHVHDRAVVALHELLDRERVGGVLVTEAAGEADLVIEQQAILAPRGEGVQAEAHLPQKRLRLLQAPQLREREERVRRQAIEAVGAEMPLRHPGDGLDVAQPPGAGLDVGLEVVGGVVGLQVPLGLLAHFRLEELLHRPDALGCQRAAHGGEQLRISGEQARFQERGHDADVADAFLGALRHGAHAVADLEPDVPQERHQGADGGAPRRVRRSRHEQQDVDVGSGVQLAAAVTPDRDQGPGLRGAVPAPGLAQRRVDERRARVHQVLDGLLGDEARLQLLVPLAQQLTPGGRLVRGGELCRQSRQQRPGDGGGRGGARFLEQL